VVHQDPGRWRRGRLLSRCDGDPLLPPPHPGAASLPSFVATSEGVCDLSVEVSPPPRRAAAPGVRLGPRGRGRTSRAGILNEVSTPGGDAISVAISTFERPDLIGRCVKSVLAGIERPRELVVVDQSRNARTREVLRSLNGELVRYEHHWPPSISGARNRAVDVARAEYVAIVDDDCTMPMDWIARLRSEIDRFERPDVLYGVIRDPAPPSPNALWVSILEPEVPQIWSYPAHPGYMGYGAHMVVRRSTFLALGGFDERLGPGTPLRAAEDLDYSYRLLKARYRAVTTPGVWVFHHQWRPQDELPADLGRRCYGQAAFCVKHIHAGDRYPWRILAEQMRSDARMLASGLRRRSGLRARAGVRRTIGTWLGLAAGWRVFHGGRG
jgi:GT2 family glycosyltransferase